MQLFGPSWVAWVIEEGSRLHAQVPFSTTSPLIAVQPPLTHGHPSWLSGTVLESADFVSRGEKASLNHTAIWADLGGLG